MGLARKALEKRQSAKEKEIKVTNDLKLEMPLASDLSFQPLITFEDDLLDASTPPSISGSESGSTPVSVSQEKEGARVVLVGSEVRIVGGDLGVDVLNSPKLRGTERPSTGHKRIMSRKEPLIYVERDTTHFDVLPRLPLTKLLFTKPTPLNISGKSAGKSGKSEKNNESTSPRTVLRSKPSSNENLSNKTLFFNSTAATAPKNSSSVIPVSSLYTLEQAAGLISFTRNGRLVLCGGRVDGSIAIREVDPRTGFILSSADFNAHHHRYVYLIWQI